MKSSAEILHIFSAKKTDVEWSFAECTPSDTGKWTHDYHRYPAKFIPQLVERLFDEYMNKTEASVNDPFYGCGTTIVSGVSRGYKASGTDINRIAHLITKVKSTPINPDYLDRQIEQFLGKVKSLQGAQTTLYGKKTEPLIPERHIERINYWFSEETKNELGRILRLIHEEEEEKLRDFLLVAFSHILKSCSIWLEGSVKPTRDFAKKPSDPYSALRKHLRRMLKGNRAFYHAVPSGVRDRVREYLNVEVGDARCQPVPDSSVDLIVSSSPYVTSYEYADLHQLSTIWFELTEDLTEYRKGFIGTSHKEYEGAKLQSEIALGIVKKMSEKSRKMAKEIEAFFVDMEQVFSESHRVLSLGGRCCYVIGDTKLKGVDILNAEVFAESLQHVGFRLDRIIKRQIPSKILPQKRDERTGRFASNDKANSQAYPVEYIVIGQKE